MTIAKIKEGDMFSNGHKKVPSSDIEVWIPAIIRYLDEQAKVTEP